MTLEEIKRNAPEGAEKYRIKNGRVIYYRIYYNGFNFEFQRWGEGKWGYTFLNDRSELKPL